MKLLSDRRGVLLLTFLTLGAIFLFIVVIFFLFIAVINPLIGLALMIFIATLVVVAGLVAIRYFQSPASYGRRSY